MSVCPSPSTNSTSSHTDVAWMTRSAPLTSGGQTPRREKTGASGNAARNAAAAPPSPTITGANESATKSKIAVSVE